VESRRDIYTVVHKVPKVQDETTQDQRFLNQSNIVYQLSSFEKLVHTTPWSIVVGQKQVPRSLARKVSDTAELCWNLEEAGQTWLMLCVFSLIGLRLRDVE
jgi:hypothetical protein